MSIFRHFFHEDGCQILVVVPGCLGFKFTGANFDRVPECLSACVWKLIIPLSHSAKSFGAIENAGMDRSWGSGRIATGNFSDIVLPHLLYISKFAEPGKSGLD